MIESISENWLSNPELTEKLSLESVTE